MSGNQANAPPIWARSGKPRSGMRKAVRYFVAIISSRHHALRHSGAAGSGAGLVFGRGQGAGQTSETGYKVVQNAM